MKRLSKILSLVVSTLLIAVMMTACGSTETGVARDIANSTQEKLANAGYSAVVEYNANAKVSIVTAKCDLSFKYNGKEKVFFTEWVSADWYNSVEDAELGYIEAQKVQGNLILKRDGDCVYMGTEDAMRIFEHKLPADVAAGKTVMQTAGYSVSDVSLSTLETSAKVSKKYKAVLGEEEIEVFWFDDLTAAADYYSKNTLKNKNKVFQKEGLCVYSGTEGAVATYKGLSNINATVTAAKEKMDNADYSTYAYKKGTAGAIKAKKKGSSSSDYDLQVGWFTNESAAQSAKTYLDTLFESEISKGAISVELDGTCLIVGTQEAIAIFKA